MSTIVANRYDQSEHLTAAQTAALLRAALKRAFPGVRFSVRSKVYSGGASIDVSWTGGPDRKDVDAIARTFAGSDFDGMIDLKYGKQSWLLPDGTVKPAHSYGTVGSRGTHEGYDYPAPCAGARLVDFGADFVFCTRYEPDECARAIATELGRSPDEAGTTRLAADLAK